MDCQGGGKIDKRNIVFEPGSLKAWIAKGGEIDKRNFVLEPDSLKAWIAKGGGKLITDKRNTILEPDSLKAWIAKGGGKLINGMLYLNMDCQGGGKIDNKSCPFLGCRVHPRIRLLKSGHVLLFKTLFNCPFEPFW